MPPVAQVVELLAPAKVNLVLRIVGRRPDGYHLLESLMVPVSWCDRVAIRAIARRSSPSRISCRVGGPHKVAGGAGNLAARAARAVLAELGIHADVKIALRKEIPSGAGLGGGSSDAAAVLRGLPTALGGRLTREQLISIALGLGADVPFFLDCRPAWAEGIGEKLRPVSGFPDVNLVVAVPRRRVSTAWAYRNALPPLCELAARNRRRRPHRVLHASVESLSSLVFNDFEARVEAAVADVGRLKKTLMERGARATVLSGSGSAVVGIFSSRPEAEEAARRFRPSDTAIAVRTVRRRPSMET